MSAQEEVIVLGSSDSDEIVIVDSASTLNVQVDSASEAAAVAPQDGQQEERRQQQNLVETLVLPDSSSSSTSSSSVRCMDQEEAPPAAAAEERSSDEVSSLHHWIRAMQPRFVSLNDIADEDRYQVTHDLDSYFASGTTLEPFKCLTLCKMDMRPRAIVESKNIKSTKYYDVRFDQGFGPMEDAAFSCSSDVWSKDNTWLEVEIGKIDNRPLFLLFQLDDSCAFLRQVPWQATVDQEGRSRVAVEAFIKLVIQRAASLMPVDSETARGGFRYAIEDVEHTYNVMESDFVAFARLVRQSLERLDLLGQCGMTCVRFYMFEHGLRLRKNKAWDLLDRIVNVDHRHIDVLQLHLADVITCLGDDGDGDDSALVVSLVGGRRQHDSLTSVYANAIKLAPRMQRYRIGFTSDYGFFDNHASPQEENHIVTFMQAYFTAAKMARPADSGMIAAYLISRGFAGGSREFQQLAKWVRQYAHNVVEYVQQYVMRKPSLRIEGVVTLDRRRVIGLMSHEIQRLRLFEDRVLSPASYILLRRNLIYRLDNWRRHVDQCIGRDMVVLRQAAQLSYGTYASEAWVSPDFVSRCIRAQFRILYFAHGPSSVHSREVATNMFVNGGSEVNSISRGVVKLRPLYDPTDTCLYKLYASRIKMFYMVPIRHIWLVIHAVEPLARKDSSAEVRCDVLTQVLKLVVTLYATWAYARLLSTYEMSDDNMNRMAVYYYANYKTAFTCRTFLREFRSRNSRHTTRTHLSGQEMQSDMLLRCILYPTVAFTQMARMALNIPDDVFDEFYNILGEFVDNHVQVFPTHFFMGRTQTYAWSVVRTEQQQQQQQAVVLTTRRGHQVPLNVDNVRQEMDAIRRAKRHGGPAVSERPRAATSQQSSADASNEEDVMRKRFDRLYGRNGRQATAAAAAAAQDDDTQSHHSSSATSSSSSSTSIDESSIASSSQLAPVSKRVRRQIMSSSSQTYETQQQQQQQQLSSEIDVAQISLSSDEDSDAPTIPRTMTTTTTSTGKISGGKLFKTPLAAPSASTAGAGPSGISKRRSTRVSVVSLPGQPKAGPSSSSSLSGLTVVGGGPAAKTKRPTIKESKRYTETMDVHILQVALETCNLINVSTWRRVKDKYPDEFRDMTELEIRYRCKQLILGMHRQEFGNSYKEELRDVRKLYRTQKF